MIFWKSGTNFSWMSNQTIQPFTFWQSRPQFIWEGGELKIFTLILLQVCLESHLRPHKSAPKMLCTYTTCCRLKQTLSKRGNEEEPWIIGWSTLKPEVLLLLAHGGQSSLRASSLEGNSFVCVRVCGSLVAFFLHLFLASFLSSWKCCHSNEFFFPEENLVSGKMGTTPWLILKLREEIPSITLC